MCCKDKDNMDNGGCTCHEDGSECSCKKEGYLGTIHEYVSKYIDRRILCPLHNVPCESAVSDEYNKMLLSYPCGCVFSFEIILKQKTDEGQ